MKFLPFPRSIVALPLLAISFSSCARAQGEAPAPVAAPATVAASTWPTLTGGTSVLPPNGLAGFRVSGGDGVAQTREAASQNPNFQRALQIQTSKKPDRDYSIRLIANNSSPIAQDDVLVATFWMRGLETKDEGSQALAAFVFENNGPSSLKSTDVSLEAPLGTAWKQFRLPFASREAYAIGEANLHFRLGMAQQFFEIAGLTVVNYGKTVKTSDFPKVVETYEGREANAPWRKAAAERIEKLRKGNL